MKAFELDGKVVLISGGAGGLAAAMATALIGGGARVVLADILDAAGQALATRLGADKAHFVHLDVTKEADWEAAVKAAVDRFGRLDAVVNNAGIETTALFTDCSLEDFNRTMNVNVSGVFLGIKHAIRAMRPGGIAGAGGSIINMSSGAGIRAAAALGAYCASKGAVRLMSKAAAIECGRLGYGIRVNSVHPGVVRSEMGDKTLKDMVSIGLMPDEATARAAFEGAHLIGLGQPDDIANAICYLVSDATRWMTGAELVVDGGWTAG